METDMLEYSRTFNVLKAVAMASTLMVAFPLSGKAGEASGDLVITRGVLRVVTVNRPAAGYFSLKNIGKVTRTLVGVASPACKNAMLHQSKMENSMMKMVHIKEIEIPAGETLSFAPGGYHIMCMHPAIDIKTKATVPVTLKFKNGDAVMSKFKVKGIK